MSCEWWSRDWLDYVERTKPYSAAFDQIVAEWKRADLPATPKKGGKGAGIVG